MIMKLLANDFETDYKNKESYTLKNNLTLTLSRKVSKLLDERQNRMGWKNFLLQFNTITFEE